ncbi:MAG: MotA/TolQ/ExbB proton channel family protein [Xanthomonadaceae bacterium]|nr:MotA/TolQ/ExbB proton channel family protein [Xanthomonadaceae bacterium]
MNRSLIASLTVALIAFAPLAGAQQEGGPAALDRLLQEVREYRQREAAVNREREQRFRADRTQQQRMLAEARAELQRQQQRATQLRNTYNANDRRLDELNALLVQRTGQFGELFGVVRMVAGEAGSVIGSSLVSAEFPERTEFLGDIAASRDLPSMEHLEQLWIALLTEMTESGKTSSFTATVMSPDGEQYESEVFRMGTFTAVTDNRFLNYSSETGRLTELPRQPAGRFTSMARKLTSGDAGDVVQVVIDPSRGALLGMLIQTPTIWEYVKQGRMVGYVIIGLLIFALGLFALRYAQLWIVTGKVNRQLKSDTPDTDNPLGRVLAVYHDNRANDLETLELKIDEAILREVPRLERGLGFIKLIAAIAPLLGLLGTVVGMIVTFQAITLYGTGDPKLMADGISTALVTTVLGLVTAIPLILLHSIAAAKSRRLVQIIEEQSAGLIATAAEKQA